MAMFDSNIDYRNFIQFTNEGGLRIATFPEIRDALMKRYKEIYGNDIDTSSASADGQFINSIALIINNMCSTFQFAFKQMNPNTATGQYLDTLCSYNNVQRISETPSTAELLIYNNSNIDIPGRDLLFMDRNGNIWQWICPVNADNEPRVTFAYGKATPITDVECLTTGAIQAFGSKFIDTNGQQTDDVNENDWTKECPATIYQFVADETDLRVWQYQDATMGRNTETDESLRSRRTQMIGVNSLSILEGLKGALLNITGIKDVFIYNNFTNDDLRLEAPIDDGMLIEPHSIYVAIRYEEGIDVDDYTIAQTIYNKLTPGVGTTGFKDSNLYHISPNDKDWTSYQIGSYPIVYWQYNASTETFENKGSTQPSEGARINIYPGVWYTTSKNSIEYFNVTDYTQSWITVSNIILKDYSWNITDSIKYTVYWKECTYQSPTISLTFKTNSNYDYVPQLYYVFNGHQFITSSQSPSNGVDISDEMENGSYYIDNNIYYIYDEDKLIWYPSSTQGESQINLNPGDYYIYISNQHLAYTEVEKNIVNNLQKYLSNIKIDSYIRVNEMLTLIQQGDIQKKGLPTLFALNGEIDGYNRELYPLNLSYLKYNTFIFSYNSSNSTGTVTIDYFDNNYEE